MKEAAMVLVLTGKRSRSTEYPEALINDYIMAVKV
jgi:hypothetical protein